MTTLRRWPELLPRHVGPVLMANLVAQTGIVLTGGLVRLTGSGLGCSTFPQCEPGRYTPTLQPEVGYHAFVEFGNRLLTFVVTVLAIAALLAVWQLRPRRRLRLLGAAPLVGVVVQAGIGGITVLTHLTPWTVMLHFMVSMGLIAVSTVLLLRVREGDGAPRSLVHPVLRQLAGVLAVLAGVVLVLGTAVTGAGPHSGDAEQPVRLGVDLRSITWLHGDAVLLFLGLAVGLYVALRITDAPRGATRWSGAVLLVTLGQGVLGYAQYALAVPAPLVWAHMLGACLLVVTVTGTQLSLRERATVSSDAPALERIPTTA